MSMSSSEPESAGVPPESAKKPSARPRRVVPFHPLLFAVFPILALFVHNLGQTPVAQLVRPLGVTLLATVAVWTFFGIVSRHVRKGAIVASAAVLLFFSYAHIRNVTPPALQGMVGPACIIGLIALLVLTLRTSRPLLDATAALNFASALLVLPSAWTLIGSLWNAHGTNGQAGHGGGTPAATIRHSPIPPPASADQPDVYYIILDAYGRADRLQTFYGYDNTPFLQELEKRGFYIARHSGANYDQTQLCIATALNMNYLQSFPDRLDPEVMRQKIDDNAVAARLRPFGYHYVNIWSGLEETRNVTPDLVLNAEPDISPFEGQALNYTPMGNNSEFQRARYDSHRARLMGVFNNLNTVAQLPYSKFVFAHALAPHPPFVFGANGEPINPHGSLNFADASWLLQQITREEYKSGYIAQLQYVNRRTLEAVDAILRQSRRPPIIIIQGDHGSRMNLDWESLQNTDLREPFSILNAYYVPEKARVHLYDTITPVNSFRIVLTYVFGLKYPLLPDRSFYSTASHPYDFTEVTGHTDTPARMVAPLASPPASAPAAAPNGER